jgi:hypothetical protein
MRTMRLRNLPDSTGSNWAQPNVSGRRRPSAGAPARQLAQRSRLPGSRRHLSAPDGRIPMGEGTGLSTLQLVPLRDRRLTRSQRGSLLLHGVTLSFTYALLVTRRFRYAEVSPKRAWGDR